MKTKLAKVFCQDVEAHNYSFICTDDISLQTVPGRASYVSNIGYTIIDNSDDSLIYTIDILLFIIITIHFSIENICDPACENDGGEKKNYILHNSYDDYYETGFIDVIVVARSTL